MEHALANKVFTCRMHPAPINLICLHQTRSADEGCRGQVLEVLDAAVQMGLTVLRAWVRRKTLTRLLARDPSRHVRLPCQQWAQPSTRMQLNY